MKFPSANAEENEDGEAAEVIITEGKATFRFKVTQIQDSAVNMKFDSSYDEDENVEVIRGEAIAKKSRVNVLGVTLPDGTYIEEQEVEYLAEENGDYDFIVHYEEEQKATSSDADRATSSDAAGTELVQTTKTFRYTATLVQPALLNAPKGLVSVTSNKENGWRWWVDDIDDVSAGNTHLQYNLKVMKDESANSVEERKITFRLGDEDGGIFQIDKTGEDSAVIKDKTLSDDKRTLKLVLNNSAIDKDSGWILGIIVLPEGKDVRSTYTSADVTYGSYIGQKFFDDQDFGASAIAIEGDRTECEIDFAWDELYTATGGADSEPWLSAAGDYTGEADSPKSLADLEMRLSDGAMILKGKQNETDKDKQKSPDIRIMTTTKLHMPAGDAANRFYTPPFWGVTKDGVPKLESFPDSTTTLKHGMGVLGEDQPGEWIVYVTETGFGPLRSLSRSPVAPGVYEAAQEAQAEWYQLEYDPNTKKISKVRKTLDYGKITVTVPNYTVVNGITFDSTERTVDEAVTDIYLQYSTKGGSGSCDYGDGTLTYTIPEHFTLEGIEKPGLFWEMTVTFDDGTSVMVPTAGMTQDEYFFTIPADRKISKLVGRFTADGIIGPYEDVRVMTDIQQHLYGRFSDPDPATDARDNPDSNRIVIEVLFESKDQSISAAGNISALYFDKGDPIEHPYVKNERTDNYLLYDSSLKSAGSKVKVGIDTLGDLGSDGLTTGSTHYKNLEIVLNPDGSGEAGAEQWKTLFGYTFDYGDASGTRNLEFYDDAWIEYTLTGETTPRRVYVYQNGTLQSSWGWDVTFPGYDAANNVFLTSLKLHFNEISIPAKKEADALRNLVAFTYNQDRRWVSANASYNGKEELSGGWKASLTYDGLAQPKEASDSFVYKLYGSAAIRRPGNHVVPGVKTPGGAARGSFIQDSIAAVLPFSVNADVYGHRYEAFYLDGKPYAAPLPEGSKVYLKLNTTYFSYYGPTKATEPDSKIELLTDANGDTWLVYDKSGEAPATNEGSNDFTIEIPGNSIMVNPTAKTNQQYEIFEKAYMDVQPLEQMSRDANIGKIDYYYLPSYDQNVLTTVEDTWGIANGSKGLAEMSVSKTQIVDAVQEQLYIVPGVDNQYIASGVHWTADKHGNLKAKIQIGSATKEYHDYQLKIELPQKGEKSYRPNPDDMKMNDYTLYLQKVTIPSSINGTVEYYDLPDCNGMASLSPTKDTKSVKITINQFTRNIEIGLELYTDENRDGSTAYTLEDDASSYLTAKADFDYYPVDETTGIVDKTQLKKGDTYSNNMGSYQFSWYTLNGKIFIEKETEAPNGLYDSSSDKLYDQNRFQFKDLTDNKAYTAKVNPSTGMYELRIPAKKADYKLAPVLPDSQYVMTVETHNTGTEASNTNFPRDWKTSGAVFAANAAGMTASTYISDFANANVGLVNRDVQGGLTPKKVMAGETLSFNVVPTSGGAFVSIDDFEHTSDYGTFTATITPGAGAGSRGIVDLAGIRETLDQDGKTLINREYVVHMTDYFGDDYTKTSVYQVYKDAFVTFQKGDGTWADGSMENEKEVRLTTANASDLTGTLSNVQAPQAEKTGHDFTGWTLTRGGVQIETLSSFDGVIFEKYDVLTPNFSINRYDVGYQLDGQVVFTDTYVYDTLVTVRDQYKKEGYTVTNWKKDGADAVNFKMPADKVVLTATSSINSYDVEYQLDGNVLFTDTYAYDTLVTVRDRFEKEGYTVTNWKKNGTDVVDFKMPASKVVLTAASSINHYKVEYQVDGHVVFTDTYAYDTLVTVRDRYVKEGYNVTNWKKDGADAVNFKMPASHVTLTADSSIGSYEVEYQLDGKVVYTDTYVYGAMVTVRDRIVKEGYEVTNWKKDGADAADFKMPGSKVVLTATSTIKRYVVTFVNYNGVVLKQETVSHGSAATAPWVPERKGYAFVGWNQAFSNVTTDLKVTAQFMKETIYYYKLSFVTNGGSRIASKRVKEYSRIQLTPVPKKEGYEFTGWYEDEGLTNLVTSLYMDDDKTVYAGWEEKEEESVPLVEEAPTLPGGEADAPARQASIRRPSSAKVESAAASEEDDENSQTGIHITPDGANGQGEDDSMASGQNGLQVTEEAGEEGVETQRPAYGKDGKQACISHWIWLLLSALMLLATLLKRRSNKQELKKLLSYETEE